jgi:hypothetical protein
LMTAISRPLSLSPRSNKYKPESKADSTNLSIRDSKAYQIRTTL